MTPSVVPLQGDQILEVLVGPITRDWKTMQVARITHLRQISLSSYFQSHRLMWFKLGLFNSVQFGVF